MSAIQGFSPIAAHDAKVLILGSMPGVASLDRQQYYGHPRNAFWPVMTRIFDGATEPDYLDRKAILTANKIALWDVLKCCYREGSLDASIKRASIQTNDFSGFFRRHPNISHVFFNGGTAEIMYRKYVMPALDESMSKLQYCRLPSTSPAYATMSLEKKTQCWRVLAEVLVFRNG